MNIALIAHDQKKEEMVRFASAYKEILKNHTLYATGTTGKKVTEATGLSVHRFQSGPLGCDQDIDSLLAKNEMDMVFLFRDPL
ncbi:methylglyoxal synthase, partial [Bacillaceae bacterium Marseille-Q3522]|nr:methylglyoxal synthase [Bacillaceae bacterium Marseille-Q3522]